MMTRITAPTMAIWQELGDGMSYPASPMLGQNFRFISDWRLWTESSQKRSEVHDSVKGALINGATVYVSLLGFHSSWTGCPDPRDQNKVKRWMPESATQLDLFINGGTYPGGTPCGLKPILTNELKAAYDEAVHEVNGAIPIQPIRLSLLNEPNEGNSNGFGVYFPRTNVDEPLEQYLNDEFFGGAPATWGDYYRMIVGRICQAALEVSLNDDCFEFAGPDTTGFGSPGGNSYARQFRDLMDVNDQYGDKWRALTVHRYSKSPVFSPNDVADWAQVRAGLDSVGFTETEIVVTEWSMPIRSESTATATAGAHFLRRIMNYANPANNCDHSVFWALREGDQVPAYPKAFQDHPAMGITNAHYLKKAAFQAMKLARRFEDVGDIMAETSFSSGLAADPVSAMAIYQDAGTWASGWRHLDHKKVAVLVAVDGDDTTDPAPVTAEQKQVNVEIRNIIGNYALDPGDKVYFDVEIYRLGQFADGSGTPWPFANAGFIEASITGNTYEPAWDAHVEDTSVLGIRGYLEQVKGWDPSQVSPVAARLKGQEPGLAREQAVQNYLNGTYDVPDVKEALQNGGVQGSMLATLRALCNGAGGLNETDVAITIENPGSVEYGAGRNNPYSISGANDYFTVSPSLTALTFPVTLPAEGAVLVEVTFSSVLRALRARR